MDTKLSLYIGGGQLICSEAEPQEIMECDEFLTRDYGSDMRRLIEVFGALILAAVFIATIASASQVTKQLRTGTAADFATSFPWVVVSLVTILFALLAWFVARYDTQREKKIDLLMTEIGNTNKALAKSTSKLDVTINTLFDRDRDIEHSIAVNAAAISSIQATCKARGDICKAVQGGYYTCPERRTGEPRRETNGYHPSRREGNGAHDESETK